MTVKTNPLIENQIASDKIVQYADGVSLFVGVMNQTGDRFFPFFGIGSNGYGDQFIFQDPNDSMEFDPKFDQIWDNNHSAKELYQLFLAKRAESLKSTTNTPIFKAVIRFAELHTKRRVRWVGRDNDFDQEGTVMKIDNQEIQILWDEHKGSKLPWFDYDTFDSRIQPVNSIQER